MKLVQQTFILLKLPVVPNDHIESHRLLALHIRFTVFEIACCNFGTCCLAVGQNATKMAKANLEEYVTPALYKKNMHLHSEQLNESFRKI